jgi:hypothetical protein
VAHTHTHATRSANMSPSVLSVGEAYKRPTTTGTQAWKTLLPDDHIGKVPIPKVDAGEQASGQVKYSGDVQPAGCLYAAFVMADKVRVILVTLVRFQLCLKLCGKKILDLTCVRATLVRFELFLQMCVMKILDLTCGCVTLLRFGQLT